MQTSEISEETAEALERNLVCKLRRQVAAWKTPRSRVRTHAAGGVVVERRVAGHRRLGRLRVERA